MAVYAEIKAAGQTPRIVWEAYRVQLAKKTGKTGLEVLEEMIAAKTEAGRNYPYLRSLKQEGKKYWRGREAIPMTEDNLDILKAHLAKFSPAYQKTIRSRLATVYKYGVKHNHCLQNLCDLIESINVEAADTRIFTLEEIQKLLKWLKKHPCALGWFVLSTFCGLRPSEAMKINPSKINFDEGWIPVDGKQTRRKSAFRIVYPLPEAMALLKYAIEKLNTTLPIASHELRKERRGMRSRRTFEAGRGIAKKEARQHSLRKTETFLFFIRPFFQYR